MILENNQTLQNTAPPAIPNPTEAAFPIVSVAVQPTPVLTSAGKRIAAGRAAILDAPPATVPGFYFDAV
jgi:hypothetical protein